MSEHDCHCDLLTQERDTARAERDALVVGIETEWYNGNIDEPARNRLLDPYQADWLAILAAAHRGSREARDDE